MGSYGSYYGFSLFYVYRPCSIFVEDQEICQEFLSTSATITKIFHDMLDGGRISEKPASYVSVDLMLMLVLLDGNSPIQLFSEWLLWFLPFVDCLVDGFLFYFCHTPCFSSNVSVSIRLSIYLSNYSFGLRFSSISSWYCSICFFSTALPIFSIILPRNSWIFIVVLRWTSFDRKVSCSLHTLSFFSTRNYLIWYRRTKAVIVFVDFSPALFFIVWGFIFWIVFLGWLCFSFLYFIYLPIVFDIDRRWRLWLRVIQISEDVNCPYGSLDCLMARSCLRNKSRFFLPPLF